jgi:two-component system sensor histidine kinase MprB
LTAWIQRRSFQGRLTALIAIAVGVAVALAATCSYLLVSEQLYNQVDKHLEGYFQQIVADQQGINQRIAVALASQGNSVVEVYTSSGSATSLSPMASALTLPPTKQQLAVIGLKGSNDALSTVRFERQDYRTLTAPVLLADGSPAALEIAQTLAPVERTLATLRLILYVVVLAGVAVAIMLGLLISRVTIRPVKRLTAAAEHVAATQQLDATIDDGGTDELGRLAHAFNEMLGALGASRQQQAQLVSDAGHELRTPLTSLRTNVELMMRAGQLPEADQRELYEDISAQIEELTTLIGDLVELARQDEQQPEPVEVRLDSIVERAVQRAQRRAPGVTFDVSLTRGSVRAQPPMLERAVLNVLDNAAKWSPADGTVEVRLIRGDRWVLEVSDHGPGIAEEDQPKVFDRFYRAPNARSMPGSGLGLAIVRQVVMAHGGQVSLEAAPWRGTLVRIELPIVVEQEPAPAGAAPAQSRPSQDPPVWPPPAPPGAGVDPPVPAPSGPAASAMATRFGRSPSP